MFRTAASSLYSTVWQTILFYLPMILQKLFSSINAWSCEHNSFLDSEYLFLELCIVFNCFIARITSGVTRSSEDPWESFKVGTLRVL